MFCGMILSMKNFAKENWFKLVVVALIVWFLIILSGLTFSDNFSVEVCLKQASNIPSLVSQRCW